MKPAQPSDPVIPATTSAFVVGFSLGAVITFQQEACTGLKQGDGFLSHAEIVGDLGSERPKSAKSAPGQGFDRKFNLLIGNWPLCRLAALGRITGPAPPLFRQVRLPRAVIRLDSDRGRRPRV